MYTTRVCTQYIILFMCYNVQHKRRFTTIEFYILFRLCTRVYVLIYRSVFFFYVIFAVLPKEQYRFFFFRLRIHIIIIHGRVRIYYCFKWLLKAVKATSAALYTVILLYTLRGRDVSAPRDLFNLRSCGRARDTRRAYATYICIKYYTFRFLPLRTHACTTHTYIRYCYGIRVV